MATLGGLGIGYYESTTNFFSDNPIIYNGWIFPALILFAKFGVSSCYIVNYIANFDLFPSKLTVTIFGMGSFLGNFVTIAAPQVAQIQGLTPVIVFTSLSAIALFASFFIQKKPFEVNN